MPTRWYLVSANYCLKAVQIQTVDSWALAYQQRAEIEHCPTRRPGERQAKAWEGSTVGTGKLKTQEQCEPVRTELWTHGPCGAQI